MAVNALLNPNESDSISPSFEIFQDWIGHWCARRKDGKVCGTFTEREAAMRFARRQW